MPVLYWLSGDLAEQNFITKAGAQQYAAQHQIIIAPPARVRGEGVPMTINLPDLGQGAGFYLNATYKRRGQRIFVWKTMGQQNCRA